MNFETGKNKNESINDKLEQDFKKLIEDKKISSEDIKEAYFRSLGISESAEQNENVKFLADEMSQMIQDGFPLNRFARLIESKEFVESIIPGYFEYIDSLDITEPEKKMLHSIIEEERSGEVYVLVDGDQFAEFELNAKGIPKQAQAVILKNTLERVIENIPKGKKYGFQFSEY